MIKNLPNVNFKIRVRDESIGGDNPFKWEEKNTNDFFKGKKTIIFSLPGAFTPTCSTFQLPDFNKLYNEFKSLGIDDIYCISVNDSFVMNAWAKSHNIDNIKVIPDGNGDFTRQMGMLVNKNNLGFGKRSWRYAAIIQDCKIMETFIEPGFEDNCNEDPYEMSSPQNILKFLKNENKEAI
ncbi:peroxiredoxin [bacterium TMED277]|nr:MAG: peroxiredoxin [bacterium TMED277]